jgi:hypothetical protein
MGLLSLIRSDLDGLLAIGNFFQIAIQDLKIKSDLLMIEEI